MIIRKLNFLFFTLFLLLLNLDANDKIRVLIIPFENNNLTDEKNVYSEIIADTLKANLNKLPNSIEVDTFENKILVNIKDEKSKTALLDNYKKDIITNMYTINGEVDNDTYNSLKKILASVDFWKYEPFLLSDLDNMVNPEYEKIYRIAQKNKIDIIINGFYYENENAITINFKVIDVFSDRVKILFNKTGKSGPDIFELIFAASDELIEKIDTELTSDNSTINLGIRKRQSRIIQGEVSEKFIFFNSGVSYSGMAFSPVKLNLTDNFNIANQYNNYMNAVNPVFNFEILGSYKKNYYGFGFNFMIPSFYFTQHIMIRSDFSLSYILGFKKVIFLSWSARMLMIGYSKFQDNLEYNFPTFYMGLGVGFQIRYLPIKYPFFIEAGFTLVPPNLHYFNLDEPQNKPVLWNITNGFVSEKNWIFPILLHIGAGYFFNDNFGIYTKNNFHLFYASYEYRKDDETISLGEEYVISFDIECGLVFKGVFK